MGVLVVVGVRGAGASGDSGPPARGPSIPRSGDRPYLDLAEAWEENLARLRKSVRKDLRRRRRRLEEAGDVTVDVRDGTDDLAALLEDGYAMEPSGWKAERGTAIISSRATRAFYTDAAEWAVTRGATRTSAWWTGRAWCGATPVGWGGMASTPDHGAPGAGARDRARDGGLSADPRPLSGRSSASGS